MFRKFTVFAATAVLLISGVCLAGDTIRPTRWFNVKVSATEDHANISVRVPMSLVTTVLDAVKTDEFQGGKLRINTEDVEIDWAKLLEAIKDAPDGQFVTVDADEATVKVEKLAGMLRINVREKTGEKKNIKIMVPAALLNAVSIDDQDRLDIKKLLASLDATISGDLVRIEAPDASVRVWID